MGWKRGGFRRRSLMMLVPAAALVLTGGLSGVVAQQGDMGTQAIRDGFTSPGRIDIQDATAGSVGRGDPYPSTINLTDLPDRAYDVNVTLRGFQHENPDDVDVLLEAPNGRASIIMADAGGNATLGSVTFSLNDEGGDPIPDSGTIQSRQTDDSDEADAGEGYDPADYSGSDDFPEVDDTQNVGFGAFDGVNPNGVWKLYVVDDENNGESGAIANGWEIEIFYGEAPEAVDDEYDARSGRRLSVSENDGVLDNDNDGDPEPGVESELTARLKKEPRKGTVRLRSDGSFVYKPEDGARGTDTFTYIVEDKDGLRDVGEVTITIRR